MTLVGYGAISMGDINVELGRSRTAQISLDTAENGGYGAINPNGTGNIPSATNPAQMSEWYGYDHNAAPAVTYTYYGILYYNDPCQGFGTYYTGSDGNWYEGDGTNFSEMTGGFVTMYDYYDPGWGIYYYTIYNLAYGGTLTYWGTTTSNCAPY